MPDITWLVTVDVRRAGAIGMFSPKGFEVQAPEVVERYQIRQAFFDQHGDRWEMHHVIDYCRKDVAMYRKAEGKETP